MAAQSLQDTVSAVLSVDASRALLDEFLVKERPDNHAVPILVKIGKFHACDSYDGRVAIAADVGKLLRSDSCLLGHAIAARVSDSVGLAHSSKVAQDSLDSAMRALELLLVHVLVNDALPRFLRSAQWAAAADAAQPRRRDSLGRALLKSLGGSFRARDAPVATPLPPPLPFLSLGGVSERKQSLHDLLSHAQARACFVEFCRSQHNEENVDFLLDLKILRQYNSHSAEAIKAKARFVLDTYIRRGSTKEANIDSKTRLQAEVFLQRCAATGSLADVSESDTTAWVAEAWEAGVTAAAATSAGPADPLAKVELELTNMLSGEVLPRFVVARAWADLLATHPTGCLAAPPDALEPSTKVGLAAAASPFMPVSLLGSAGSGVHSAALAPQREPADATASAAVSLRDKFYVFGLSLKPRLFGSKSKVAEVDAAGASIRVAHIKSGFLLKRAHHKVSWKRRWFVLAPFALAYYDTPREKSPSGVVTTAEIQGISVRWDPTFLAGSTPTSTAGAKLPPSPDSPMRHAEAWGTHPALAADVSCMPYVFFVYTAHRTYALQASSDRDRLRWMYALDRARIGDSGAVRAAEQSGYAGLEGSTAAADLLSRASLFYRTADPPDHLVTTLGTHSDSDSEVEMSTGDAPAGI